MTGEAFFHGSVNFLNRVQPMNADHFLTVRGNRLVDASGELSNGACKILLREADEIARVIASIIVKAKKGTRD